MYYANEEALTATIKQIVNTQGFAGYIDLVLNSYLQYLKMQNEISTRYMEKLPFSSKHDAARVAELIVALENKVDHLEEDFTTELEKISKNTAAWSEFVAGRSDKDLGSGAEEVSPMIDQALESVNDMAQRVTNLEAAVKRVEVLLGDVNKNLKGAAKKTKKTAAAKEVKE